MSSDAGGDGLVTGEEKGGVEIVIWVGCPVISGETRGV